MTEHSLSDSWQPSLRDTARHPFPGAQKPGSFRFSPDGQYLYYLDSQTDNLSLSLWRLKLENLERECLLEPDQQLSSPADETLEEALLKERRRQRSSGIESYRLLKDQDILIIQGRNPFIFNADSKTRRDLTEGRSPCLDIKRIPGQDAISFIRDGELWRIELDGSGLRCLTSGPKGTTRGVADYLAQEEMGRSSGYFWSPSGTHVAFFEVDEQHIPVFPIVHQGKDQVVVEDHHYPFAGQQNPKAELKVLDPESGQIWPVPGLEDWAYVPRVHWFDDQHLGVQVQDRHQRRLQLLKVQFETGQAQVLLEESQPEAWVNLNNGFELLPEGQFLWLSERSGYQHLELRGADGQVIRELSSGPWMVTRIVQVDKSTETVSFMATKDSPLERQLYRVSWSAEQPKLERLSHETGCWQANAVFDSENNRRLELWSRYDQPLCVDLYDAGGKVQRLFDLSDRDPRCQALTPPEFISLKAADGHELHGAFYRAQGVTGARPLIVYVYGGPHAQRVHKAWEITADMRCQFWARSGFHVLKLDNRGSANRGLAFEAVVRHDMGRHEVADQAAGVRFLVERGDVDARRVGIVGWSYGGYMACMSLMRAPGVFQVGVSGAPVTHWDGYDTHYTERYMGLPEEQHEAYQVSSVMSHVNKLEGRLLLVHGLIDENVHFRHTGRLIQALIEADKDYDLLVFPDERHMPRSEDARFYMERRIFEYFKEHLGAD